ncbi:hypothetical protein ES705_43236 [subsurface metagenome]
MTEVVIVSGIRTAIGNVTFPVFHSQGTRWRWGALGCDRHYANSICSYHTGICSFLVPS